MRSVSSVNVTESEDMKDDKIIDGIPFYLQVRASGVEDTIKHPFKFIFTVLFWTIIVVGVALIISYILVL